MPPKGCQVATKKVVQSPSRMTGGREAHNNMKMLYGGTILQFLKHGHIAAPIIAEAEIGSAGFPSNSNTSMDTTTRASIKTLGTDSSKQFQMCVSMNIKHSVQ